MNKKFIKFPNGFLWGGASASEQYEGHGDTGKGKTVWDKFYETDKKAFWNQIGPSITSDFFNKYKDDLDLFKSFGVNSIRIGISWARVIPDGKNVSQKGLQFYKDVVSYANKIGIKLVLNIFHFDMPLWADKMGNFESKEVINKIVEFADVIFKNFANEVDYIATFNEPGVPIFAGYQGKSHWPRVQDNKRAFQAAYGVILAHAKMVNLYNNKYKNSKAKIGAIINVNPPIAKDGKTASKDDKEAAMIFDLLHNKFWLYPMIKGEWPKEGVEFAKKHNVVPIHTKEELEIIKKVKLDFIGTNFYSPTRIVSKKSKGNNLLVELFEHYHYGKARYNVFRGWEIRPESLYDLSMLIKNEFNNIPFFIYENGMGVEGEEKYRASNGEIQDDYRIAFLQEHLEQLNKAMNEGANCFGYHMWAITDNWSWRNAYKNRYGFVEINLNDLSRKLKKSAHWFKKVINNNGFYDGFKKIEETIDLVNASFTESV